MYRRIRDLREDSDLLQRDLAAYTVLQNHLDRRN